MTKKYNRIKFCVIALIAVIGLVLTFFSFNVPTTTTTFRGFFNALPLDYDVNGGTMAIYEAQKDDEISQADFEEDLNNAISNLSKTLSSKGYEVVRLDGNLIRVDASAFNSTSSIFNLIGSKDGVNITKDSTGETVGVAGADIESCIASYQSMAGTWGVTINFTEEGGDKFFDLTEEVAGSESDKTLYFFVDGQLLSKVSVSEAISGGTTFISMETQSAAESYALQISTVSNNIYFKEISNGKTTAPIGNNFVLMLIIALAVILVATFVFMILRYGILGVLADLAYVFYAIIYIFLLQAIPLTNLSIAGIIGTLISYIVLIDATVMVFERIKKEYYSGKKIPNSVMSGFKKTIRPTLETHIILLVLCFATYFVGVKAFSDLAVSLFIGLFVSYFTVFVALRGFAKLFLTIDSIHPKTYRLKKREGKKNEI